MFQLMHCQIISVKEYRCEILMEANLNAMLKSLLRLAKPCSHQNRMNGKRITATKVLNLVLFYQRNNLLIKAELKANWLAELVTVHLGALVQTP